MFWTGCNDLERGLGAPPHPGYRNQALPPTYQLGLYRLPVPGSPEIFGLPQTTEPGPFYRPAMNHYFAPTSVCLPYNVDLPGACGNINFIRVNERALSSLRRRLF